MTNRKNTHQSQGVQRKNEIKAHPENIIKNPALEYNGSSATLGSISDPGNSRGGAVSQSKDEQETDFTNPGPDFNRSGGIRNQGVNEQNAGNQGYGSRPGEKLSGKEGKTMTKNVGMHENNPEAE
jgi:hypothetical protein